MRIGVHGRSMAPSNLPAVLHVLARMRAHGLEPLLDEDMRAWLAENGQAVSGGVLARAGGRLKDVDLVLSLGGDGTFLGSVAMVGRAGVPVLGINLGRLGFLSSVTLEATDQALDAIVNERFTLEERSLLQVEGAPELGEHNFALNEVSLHKRDSSSMITVHAHVGDQFLNTYWADGLIVATPTGSTAYSLSCGGPLLDPRCDALVITPIAPHNLNVRPFVVPDSHPIRLAAEARGGEVPAQPRFAQRDPGVGQPHHRVARALQREARAPQRPRLPEHPAHQAHLGARCALGPSPAARRRLSPGGRQTLLIHPLRPVRLAAGG